MGESTFESIFHEALALPPAARSEYLDRACQGDRTVRDQVESLLEAHEQAGGFMGEVTIESAATIDQIDSEQAESPQRQGQVIGRYRLLQQIGEGGFGTVWMAEQEEPVKRRVALKIIKLGMDTRQVIARFEAERQALALMDHANIARVFDAGTTDAGRPFFVMEYIRGVPIIDYCDDHRLDTPARLHLFAEVCRAIQHAHQKGIIHRDIKPSNVLVSIHDGGPIVKVIDFGIAKAIHTPLTTKTLFTENQQMIGTPAYMSPEQAEMSNLDIDTRADIYSLGVLLYQMLTGTTPFDSATLMGAGVAEMMRIIREEEPHKPSTRIGTLGESASRYAEKRRVDMRHLTTQLRGDLDWIVMKCLEKDRTRRYDTAAGLVDDIRRHLADEPVGAGPPSAVYRLQKFVKRNRGQVVAASLVAAALLVGALGTAGGLVWALQQKSRADTEAQRAVAAATAEGKQRRKAELSEQRAMSEADRALAAEASANARAAELQQLVSFQTEQLAGMDVPAMGVQIRELLLNECPAAQRESLMVLLAEVNFTDVAIGTLESSIFDRTLAAIDAQFDGQPLVQAQMLQTVSETMSALSMLNAASDPLERALAFQTQHLGPDDAATLASMNSLGYLRSRQGRLEEADSCYRDALAGRRRTLGDEHIQTLESINNLGFMCMKRAQMDEAEALFREALDGRMRVLGEQHADTLQTLNNMGVLLERLGRIDECERYYQRALDGRRAVLGDQHPRTLISINNMGYFLLNQGRLDEAEAFYREALAGRRRMLGDEHPQTLGSINNLGFLYLRQGDLAAAALAWQESLVAYRRTLGDDHPDTLNAISNMAFLMQQQERWEDAERLYREALIIRLEKLGDTHPDTWASTFKLGALLNLLQRFEEAEPLLRQAAEADPESLGGHRWRVAEARSLLGEALTGLARYEEAEPWLMSGHEALLVTVPEAMRVDAIRDSFDRLLAFGEATRQSEAVARWKQERDAMLSVPDAAE